MKKSSIAIAVSTSIISIAALIFSTIAFSRASLLSYFYEEINDGDFFLSWGWVLVALFAVFTLVLLWVRVLYQKRVTIGVKLAALILTVSVLILAFNWNQELKGYPYVDLMNIGTDKEMTRIDKNGLYQITLEELDKAGQSTTLEVIYIGRDSCPQCQDLEPRLKEVSNQCELEFQYYNTSDDREKNYDAMLTVLKKHKVNSVPAILVFQRGHVVKQYEGTEKDLQQLQDFVKRNL